jgi:hypothetical protein
VGWWGAAVVLGNELAFVEWTRGSSVREVLTNRKYTGYMVWNRKATTSAGGRNNPPEAWIWSSAPTHPALVDVEAVTDAQ